MLLVGFEDLGQFILKTKYPNKFNILITQDIKNNSNIKNDNELFLYYMNEIKASINTYSVTYVDYSKELIACLQVLNIPFKLIYTGKSIKEEIKQLLTTQNVDTYILEDKTLEWYLSKHYDWVNIQQQTVEKEQNKQLEELEIKVNSISNSNNVPLIQFKEIQLPEIPLKSIPINSLSTDSLSIDMLANDNVQITESMVREGKVIENKIKLSLLLQAKANLKRVHKLTITVDNLLDELLDRVDKSLQFTDTSSLMGTTDYLSKLLTQTNQFLISLINNDKMQNFFVIDNSNVVNINSVDVLDVEKRDRIRKAAEIVMDNIDCFIEGDYDNLKYPTPTATIIQDEMEAKNNVSEST